MTYVIERVDRRGMPDRYARAIGAGFSEPSRAHR